MKRLTEPELMLDDEQARAYATADFSSAHSRYPLLFAELFPNRPRRALVLDIGCGPCDVTLRFATGNPGYRFHAVDGSAAMLKYARKNIRCSGGSVSRRSFHPPTPGASQKRRLYLPTSSLL
jgi:trans-aconitate methyltransferase